MQGSSKDLTASRMLKDPFLQGSLLKCSSSPGTCIPCKLGSRPVRRYSCNAAAKRNATSCALGASCKRKVMGGDVLEMKMRVKI